MLSDLVDTYRREKAKHKRTKAPCLNIFLVSLAASLSCSAATQDCIDSDHDWVDAYGDSCTEYATFNYCTSTGGYGSGWASSWGEFDDYATGGFTAVDVCCVCGGGIQRSLPSSAPTITIDPKSAVCVDSPIGWTDTARENCRQYVDKLYCTKTGLMGSGWRTEWGSIFDYTPPGGVSAWLACCGCGGGRLIPAPPSLNPTTFPTRTPVAAPTLVPTLLPTSPPPTHVPKAAIKISRLPDQVYRLASHVTFDIHYSTPENPSNFRIRVSIKQSNNLHGSWVYPTSWNGATTVKATFNKLLELGTITVLVYMVPSSNPKYSANIVRDSNKTSVVDFEISTTPTTTQSTTETTTTAKTTTYIPDPTTPPTWMPTREPTSIADQPTVSIVFPGDLASLSNAGKSTFRAAILHEFSERNPLLSALGSIYVVLHSGSITAVVYLPESVTMSLVHDIARDIWTNPFRLSLDSDVVVSRTAYADAVSHAPTSVPTQMPISSGPTVTPTYLLTMEPTVAPSSHPSFPPTLIPTYIPTKFPTEIPSTNVPTSTQPSGIPTYSPSTATPTRIPSTSPSRRPTTNPSLTPTKHPSEIPTGQPTVDPCSIHRCSKDCEGPVMLGDKSFYCGWDRESNTCRTGFLTTNAEVLAMLETSSGDCSHHTISPSTVPSWSPISIPTSIPTVDPSKSPSSHPSKSPSSQASVSPTGFPSLSPSQFPSVGPSTIPTTFPTSDPCLTVRCSADCEGLARISDNSQLLFCGWDSRSSMCRTGFVTSRTELEAMLETSPGDCSHHNSIPSVVSTKSPQSHVQSKAPSIAPSTTPTHTPSTRVPQTYTHSSSLIPPSKLPTSDHDPCLDISCSALCDPIWLHDGVLKRCGWDKERNLCIQGFITTQEEREAMLESYPGGCRASNTTTSYLPTISNDPCSVHTCSADCGGSVAVNASGVTILQSNCRPDDGPFCAIAASLCDDVSIRKTCESTCCRSDTGGAEIYQCGWDSAAVACRSGHMTTEQEKDALIESDPGACSMYTDSTQPLTITAATPPMRTVCVNEGDYCSTLSLASGAGVMDLKCCNTRGLIGLCDRGACRLVSSIETVTKSPIRDKSAMPPRDVPITVRSDWDPDESTDDSKTSSNIMTYLIIAFVGGIFLVVFLCGYHRYLMKKRLKVIRKKRKIRKHISDKMVSPDYIFDEMQTQKSDETYSYVRIDTDISEATSTSTNTEYTPVERHCDKPQENTAHSNNPAVSKTNSNAPRELRKPRRQVGKRAKEIRENRFDKIYDMSKDHINDTSQT